MADPLRPIEAEVQRLYDAKRAWHEQCSRLPLSEKVRILLDLQRQDLPLIARQRPLQWWEQPWEIRP